MRRDGGTKFWQSSMALSGLVRGAIIGAAGLVVGVNHVRTGKPRTTGTMPPAACGAVRDTAAAREATEALVAQVDAVKAKTEAVIEGRVQAEAECRLAARREADAQQHVAELQVALRNSESKAAATAIDLVTESVAPTAGHGYVGPWI